MGGTQLSKQIFFFFSDQNVRQDCENYVVTLDCYNFKEVSKNNLDELPF